MAVGYVLDLEERRREELAATMQVSIGSYRDRVARGTVTCMLDRKPIPFCGLDQMLLLMESLLDHGGAGGWEHYSPGKEAIHMNGEKSHSDGQPRIRDFPQNFRIRVYGRDHHSLQGELRAGSQVTCFRSSLELVRLIYQELGKQPGKAKQREPSLFEETKKICK